MNKPEKQKTEESGVFKVLKLVAKTDWRSLLLILTALTGALGAVWNKLDLYTAHEVQVQAQDATRSTSEASGGAYEVLATRLDEAFVRIEAIEKRFRIKTEYTPPVETKPETVGSTEEVVKEEKIVAEVIEPQKEEAAPAPMPIAEQFQRARLPKFEQIRQRATEGGLRDFVKKVKGK